MTKFSSHDRRDAETVVSESAGGKSLFPVLDGSKLRVTSRLKLILAFKNEI